MIGTDNLTLTSDIQARTAPGMASWAIGPNQCWQCINWMSNDREAERLMKARPCRKYRELMPRDGTIRGIMGTSMSCRYFEPFVREEK